MSKKTAFRFYVAEGDKCSSTWSLAIKKNDIYLSHNGSHQDKISLHESGSYQWSVRSEQQINVPFARDDRHIAKWTRPDAPPGSLTRQFFVLIPTSELQSGRERTAKQAAFLRAPALGWATCIDFYFFTPHSGKTVASTSWTPEPIFEDRLANGRFLVITSGHIPMDANTAFKFDAVKAMARHEGEKHRKDPTRALAKLQDAKGIWGIAEVAVNG